MTWLGVSWTEHYGLVVICGSTLGRNSGDYVSISQVMYVLRVWV